MIWLGCANDPVDQRVDSLGHRLVVRLAYKTAVVVQSGGLQALSTQTFATHHQLVHHMLMALPCSDGQRCETVDLHRLICSGLEQHANHRDVPVLRSVQQQLECTTGIRIRSKEDQRVCKPGSMAVGGSICRAVISVQKLISGLTTHPCRDQERRGPIIIGRVHVRPCPTKSSNGIIVALADRH